MERGSTAAASSTPLHYPSAAAMQAVVKVAPALAAGCAVLLKPSPLASLSCLQLEAIATEAGLPHPYPYPYPNPNPNPNPTRTRTLALSLTLTRWGPTCEVLVQPAVARPERFNGWCVYPPAG